MNLLVENGMAVDAFVFCCVVGSSDEDVSCQASSAMTQAEKPCESLLLPCFQEWNHFPRPRSPLLIQQERLVPLQLRLDWKLLGGR